MAYAGDDASDRHKQLGALATAVAWLAVKLGGDRCISLEGGIRGSRAVRKKKHRVAVHAGDEVGGVVAQAHTAHADALEVFRAATAGQAEV